MHPLDLAFVAVGFLNGGVDYVQHDRRYIDTDAIAFDKWNDRKIRDIEAIVLIRCNGRAIGGHIDMIVMHGASRGPGKACIVQIVEDHK